MPAGYSHLLPQNQRLPAVVWAPSLQGALSRTRFCKTVSRLPNFTAERWFATISLTVRPSLPLTADACQVSFKRLLFVAFASEKCAVHQLSAWEPGQSQSIAPPESFVARLAVYHLVCGGGDRVNIVRRQKCVVRMYVMRTCS